MEETLKEILKELKEIHKEIRLSAKVTEADKTLERIKSEVIRQMWEANEDG